MNKKEIEKACKDLNRLVPIVTWWHKRKFPNETLKSQELKIEEEIGELEAADWNYMLNPTPENESLFYEEAADCFISICGKRRWKRTVAEYQLNTLGFDHVDNVVKHVEAIKAKLWINHKSSFVVVDGVNKRVKVEND